MPTLDRKQQQQQLKKNLFKKHRKSSSFSGPIHGQDTTHHENGKFTWSISTDDFQYNQDKISSKSTSIKQKFQRALSREKVE